MESKIIDVHIGGQSECWLVVHVNGRIIYHTENTGYSILRHGVSPHDVPINLEKVVELEARYGKDLVMQVVTALLELRNRVGHTVRQPTERARW
jgi:hypothetical protein